MCLRVRAGNGVCACLCEKYQVIRGHRGQMVCVCTLEKRVCVTLCSCLSRLELNLCDDAANTVTSSRINSSVPRKLLCSHSIHPCKSFQEHYAGTRMAENLLLLIRMTCSITLLAQIAAQSLLLQQAVVKTTCCKSYKHV